MGFGHGKKHKILLLCQTIAAVPAFFHSLYLCTTFWAPALAASSAARHWWYIIDADESTWANQEFPASVETHRIWSNSVVLLFGGKFTLSCVCSFEFNIRNFGVVLIQSWMLHSFHCFCWMSITFYPPEAFGFKMDLDKNKYHIM